MVGALPLALVLGVTLGAVIWMQTRSILERTAGAADLLPTVLAAAVLAGCSAPAAVTAPPSPAGDGAYAHLAELQRITDAAGGTRTTPSPGYDAAVDHVAAVLRAEPVQP